MPDSEQPRPPPSALNSSQSAASTRPKISNPENGASTSSGGVGASGSGSAATPSKAMVKYGELVILGYNGQLPQGKRNFL